MASTYSNLKIQLMGTGENSGTWGNVTNVNLGTAIEEAIVGSADVTFSSSDVTLTLTDTNTTQSARNLRLNLIGVSGGARQLIVPSIEKVYIINNALADTVTVKNTTGNGVAVPAGKSMWVYNTGSNVVDVMTHLTSLTLGTPLALDQGGTGSNTGTFSGANITSLNASNISSGTLANARTTATDSNGASTIVARDASGNFAANVITANGSALTALNATSLTSGSLPVARLPAGSIIQQVTGSNSTQFATSSTSYVDCGLSASIVPSSASSKILVMITNLLSGTRNTEAGVGAQIVRDSTSIMANTPSVYGFAQNSATNTHVNTTTFIILDSPATTSSVTYKLQILANPSGGTGYAQYANQLATITLFEVKA